MLSIEYPAWLKTALCSGRSDFVLASTSGEATLRKKAALPLAICGWCPHRAECVEFVQPRTSRFDGVCGGRLWLNGRELAHSPGLAEEPTPAESGDRRPPCGTATGRAAHERRGEPVCLSCASAARSRPSAAARPRRPAAA
ncbi:hypothetical protein ABZ649_04760 [Streptomyces albidoflavus]|uniref:hypothetical protein n=1 Tax=Streptomyces albidoflavus TaxID=1886 RepID=UPI0033D6408C